VAAKFGDEWLHSPQQGCDAFKPQKTKSATCLLTAQQCEGHHLLLNTPDEKPSGVTLTGPASFSPDKGIMCQQALRTRTYTLAGMYCAAQYGAGLVWLHTKHVGYKRF
jgi:hypothetical protein